MQQQSLQAVPPKLHPRQPDKGFVLLHTLVLLLIGSSLVAIVLGLGLGRARDFSAEATARRLELAAESGVHNVLFRLAEKEVARTKDVDSLKRVEVDGFEVELETQFSDGLVGLRSAEKRQIQEVLVAALGSRASTAFSSLSSSASLSSYADLASLEGVGVAGLTCLLPYVTLYSDSVTPIPKHAPPKLRTLLALKNDAVPGAIQDDAVSLAGSVIRIQSHANSGNYHSRRLLVEAMITGRTDQPAWILEWFWVPADTAGISKQNPC